MAFSNFTALLRRIIRIILIFAFGLSSVHPAGVVQARLTRSNESGSLQIPFQINRQDIDEITPEPTDTNEFLHSEDGTDSLEASPTPTPSETTHSQLEEPSPTPNETPTPTEIPQETPTETPTPAFTDTPTATNTPTNTVQPGLQVSSLSIAFTVKPAQAAPGDVVTCTVLITNKDQAPITGLVFSNKLPQIFEFVPGEPGLLTFDPQTRLLTWNGETIQQNQADPNLDQKPNPTLLPGETVTFSYTIKVSNKVNKVEVIDAAELSADGLSQPIIAKARLLVAGSKQNVAKIDSAGGKVTGLDGRITLDFPAGALTSSNDIAIQKIEKVDKTLVTELYLDNNPVENASTENFPGEGFSAGSTPPGGTPTENAPLEETPIDGSGFIFSLELFDPQKTTEISSTPDEHQQLQPTQTATPGTSSEDFSKPDGIIGSSDFGQELPEEPAETSTASLDENQINPEGMGAPEPTAIPEAVTTAAFEEDQIIPIEPLSIGFEQPVLMTISMAGMTDLATLNADQAPFLVTLDEASGTWIRVPLKAIDRETNTIQAEIKHFSTWGVGIGPSFPQNGANILQFDRAYPDLFTGRSSYSLPIWTPPGRNGMAPAISLSYSSGSADGALGDIQAPWTGMGWKIDTVEIARKITNGICNPCGGSSFGYENKFLLLINGEGYELIPDGTTPGRFHTKEESYLYIQLHNDDLNNNDPAASNTTGEWWEVIETDGTRWRLGATNASEQVAAMKGYPGTDSGAWAALGYAGHAADVVASRWRADRTVDTFGNLMTYSYTEETRLVAGTSAYYDRANYLDTISYTGHTSGSPDPAYSVVFILESRGSSEVPEPQYDWDNWDTNRLDRIEVRHNSTVVRTYDLGYDVRSYSDDGKAWETTTLTSVVVSGGSASEPAITFSYTDQDNRANCGSGCQEWAYPRLSSIQNGRGGVLSFSYANDGRPSTSWYNWKVAGQSVSDGVASSPMTTGFSYSTPCYDDPTAGRCNGGNVGELVGYGQSTATTYDYDGSTPLAIAVHYFHTDLQKSGKESQIQYKDGSGAVLSQTITGYTVVTSGLPADGFFTYSSQVDSYLRGASLNLVSQVAYTYDGATGNLTNEREYDGSSNLYRQTFYEYVTNTTPSVWILDTVSQITVQDAGSAVISKRQNGYDGDLPGSGSPTQGKLTLSREVDGSQTIDTGYVYDSTYGFLTETRSYGSDGNYGQTGSLPTGTYYSYTSGYDSTGTYVTSSTNPLNHTVSTGYDYDLGLATSVTDANGNTTETTYDGLGRVTGIKYPGYSQANVVYTYQDSSASAPFSIKMEAWDEPASAYRVAWQVFDGLGRVLQTQGPSQNSGELILSDVSYDATGAVRLQGNPRGAAISGGSYDSPAWSSLPHTTTSYDALGRTTTVVYADDSESSLSYSGLRTTAIDQNSHQVVKELDAFGRLIKVEEYTGDSSYTLYATTTYGYNARDQLTNVTDAEDNQTGISYNGFGRKVAMTDPDMGAWSYGYDVFGNLTSQTDARDCTTTVSYDALNRPTGKSFSGSAGAPASCAGTPAIAYSYDSTANGNQGIGRRTGMSDGSGSSGWQYNALGQVTSGTKTVDGVDYTTGASMDAFGRTLTQSLPSGESLSFGYNATGALTSLSGTSNYLTGANYNAGGQLTEQQLGNGVISQYCYDSTTLRLSKLRAYTDTLQSCGETPSGLKLNLSYSYQPYGNISQMVDDTRGVTINFTYDELDRLLNTDLPFEMVNSFNSIGNILSKDSITSYLAIAAGTNHTCALTSIGGVKCWGDNETGQLGDGTTDQRSIPVNVSGLTSGVVSIAAGNAHTCALTSAGGVKCWGNNETGQLGDGTTNKRSIPVNVSGLTSGVVAIIAGNAHTCAVTSTGGMKCWGNNTNGRLGDGTTTQRKTPVDVSGLTSGVVAIAAGNAHTCALTSAGGLKCWGNNATGQLGDGTTTQRLTPVDVSGLTSGVVAITAGNAHTCALTSAGGAKCWGNNTNGRLGDGTTTQRKTPVDVSGLTSGVAVIAAGNAHTCALTSAGGAKCWGDNATGQLGDGTTTQRKTPVNVDEMNNGVVAITTGGGHTCALTAVGQVKCWGYSYYGQLADNVTSWHSTPVDVSGLTSGILLVDTGTSYSCALNSVGGIKCWGKNASSQLGDGTATQRLTPVDVSGLTSGVVAVATGGKHTCALTTSGGVKCWGYGYLGQLGNGTISIRKTPVNVSGLTSGVVAIATGDNHSCALTSAGGVKCWGMNEFGQLGDGTTTWRYTPVDVSGLTSGVVAIAAGYMHTCALTSTGGVKCWGMGEAGQLGDGTDTDRTTPVDVSGLTSGVAAIAAGGLHTCALTTSGGMKCWGTSSRGQIGDGSPGMDSTPVDVSGLASGVAAIATGYLHTCALTTSGGMKCWGGNSEGEVGDGTTEDRNVPVDVSGLTQGVMAIAAGYDHTCAVTTSGGTKCWGLNEYGQLGNGEQFYRTTPSVIEETSMPVGYQYDDPNHIHAVTTLSNGNSCQYDANGNMTQRVEGGITYTQVFDAENHLVSVTANSQTTQFVYDGDGNLVKKINPDNTSTIFIGSIYEVQKDVGGTATGATTYYPAAGAMRVNGTLYYVLRDRLGSASVVLNDSGGIVGETRYYPFGEARETSGSLLTDRLFTGQREMAGLGLYHYGARFYSPGLGRFIQPDTLVPDPGNPQSFNRFSYVNNNPINFTDPSGNRPFGECEKNESCRRTATTNAEAARNAHLQIVSNDDMNGCKGANCNRGLEIVTFATVSLVTSAVVTTMVLDLAFIVGDTIITTAGTTIGATKTACNGEECLSGLRKTSQMIGDWGEATSKIFKNTLRIPSLTGTAKYRVPDQIIEELNLITEVKNVTYLPLCNQINDYLLYAQSKGMTFEIIARPDTIFSGPLQTLVTKGIILTTRINMPH